ncbi:MAG: inorganic diphosphatase [Alphaproteobacteria bacterium]|nr:inorganic diphosphatase [Alphaproteobacteria bacterium]MBV8549034.1 inorganic diphosphatase [Alphaproteobacteria bacterium]
MDIKKIPTGKNPPDEINVIIEIPQGSSLKYEHDKDSGAIFVDRYLSTPMHYPCDYGYIPHTLSDDGDPCDVLVVSPQPIMPGCVIACRPVGVLKMKDEKGGDEKIVAVPIDKLTKLYANVKSHTDLPQPLCEQIDHFFRRYKDLEKGKFVEVLGWGDAEEAKSMIRAAIQRVAKAA